jgi:hypothetical protein
MAAGFFKTAAEIQPEDILPASRKRLLGLANSLVEDAAT